MRRLKESNHIRQEYVDKWIRYKDVDYDKYRWEMSNSRYILWLEEKILNLPPPTSYLFIFYDLTNRKELPYISSHRTKLGAYKKMRKYTYSLYMEWYNNRIIFGKQRNGIRPDFTQCWEIIESPIRP